MIASTALCGGRPYRRRSVRRIKFQHRFQQRKSRVALFQLWVSVPSIHRSARTHDCCNATSSKCHCAQILGVGWWFSLGRKVLRLVRGSICELQQTASHCRI